MIKEINLRVLPQESHDSGLLKKAISRELEIHWDQISDFKILKRSIDARQKIIWIQLRLQVALDGSEIETEFEETNFQDVSNSKEVLIVGTGPAGLFAALRLIELGLKPVLFERGKKVRERRRDLVKITRNNEVDLNSNYCFGEGGAGTYSDGKLYTRSGNKKQIRAVLKTFVEFGAPHDIMVDAHPHIGTNKLPAIIQDMREKILACGGLIHFESKVTDFLIKDRKIEGLVINGLKQVKGEHLILATGHSARDVFQLVSENNIELEFKSFALGVRVEHPQSFIDQIRYKSAERSDYLPPASYSLVTQSKNHGVYSFCMCPGGIIAPCATDNEEIVTNGWSPSKRNNPYANSGIVVEVKWSDIENFHQYGALAGLEFQKSVERACWESTKGNQHAPAQKLTDFMRARVSESLPECSYRPGLESKRVDQILPQFISERLKLAFKEFEKNMPGFIHEKALVVAPESRTSSPIRIPRDKETMENNDLKGLYPCGEGAGYAGGIVSAAIDGKKVAEKIAETILE